MDIDKVVLGRVKKNKDNFATMCANKTIKLADDE